MCRDLIMTPDYVASWNRRLIKVCFSSDFWLHSLRNLMASILCMSSFLFVSSASIGNWCHIKMICRFSYSSIRQMLLSTDQCGRDVNFWGQILKYLSLVIKLSVIFFSIFVIDWNILCLTCLTANLGVYADVIKGLKAECTLLISENVTYLFGPFEEVWESCVCILGHCNDVLGDVISRSSWKAKVLMVKTICITIKIRLHV